MAATTGTATGTTPSGGSTRAKVFLSILGILLLALLVREVGSAELLARLIALGWAAPLSLLPFCLIAWFDGWAWAYTLPAPRAARRSILRLTLIRLAGEAVNNLTPTASVGGEPLKAFMLRRDGIDLSSGTVSIVVAKTALTVGQILLTLLGIMLTLERFDWIQNGDFLFAGLCAAGAAFVALLIHLQQRQLFSRLAAIPGRLGWHGPRTDRFQRLAPEIDTQLGSFYRSRGGDFSRATFLHFIGWMLGTVEVKTLAALVHYDLSWRDAFIIDSIAQPLSLGAALIPGALGVREAGGVAIFSFLGLDESAGLAVWLLIRFRETVFSLIGLLFMIYEGRREIGGVPSTVSPAKGP
jgi:glycosyltransferase 2 family protein